VWEPRTIVDAGNVIVYTSGAGTDGPKTREARATYDEKGIINYAEPESEIVIQDIGGIKIRNKF
jgi:hypothetical protein